MLLITAHLLACVDEDPDLVAPDTGGPPVCGRLDGTSNILLYQDLGDTIRAPEEAPDPDVVATGVAGPVGGEYGYLAVENGRVIQSEDGGCSWSRQSDLPSSGDWRLTVAGDRVYAFDVRSGDGARTDDLGSSWSTFALGAAPLGLPTVDAADFERVRAVTADEVYTSADGGDTWAGTGTLPEDAGAVAVSAVGASDLDVIVLGTETGVSLSRNGGASWDARSVTGAASSVAVHPDDADVLFAQFPDADGTLTIWRSEDAGGDWSPLVAADQVDMEPGQDIWPLPGEPTTAISALGPVLNSNDEPSLALYVMEDGVGTHTVRVTLYYHLHQLAFGAERWVAAVDSVE